MRIQLIQSKRTKRRKEIRTNYGCKARHLRKCRKSSGDYSKTLVCLNTQKVKVVCKKERVMNHQRILIFQAMKTQHQCRLPIQFSRNLRICSTGQIIKIIGLITTNLSLIKNIKIGSKAISNTMSTRISQILSQMHKLSQTCIQISTFMICNMTRL